MQIGLSYRDPLCAGPHTKSGRTVILCLQHCGRKCQALRLQAWHRDCGPTLQSHGGKDEESKKEHIIVAEFTQGSDRSLKLRQVVSGVGVHFLLYPWIGILQAVVGQRATSVCRKAFCEFPRELTMMLHLRCVALN